MKQVIIFIIILNFNIMHLNAQKEFKRYTEIGGKVGWSPINNVSMISKNKPVTFNNSLLGFRFLHAEQKFGGIIVEINYNKSTTTFDGKNYSYDFIHTPVMTHVFIPVKKTTAALNVGSYLQFITDRSSYDIILERNVLFGLVGGVSFCVPIKYISLTFEGRINYNLFSNSKKDYTKLGNWMEFSVAACYRKKWK
jgi:hypothetical protein